MENVWKFGGWSKRHYLTHPWKWIAYFFKRMKWAWQRSVRGYADCDCWNMDYWMIDILAPMFEDFAKNHIGYPGEENGFTDEQWTKYLLEIAEHLRNSHEDQESVINEYAEDFETIIDCRTRRCKRWTDDKGFVHHEFPEVTPEENELIAKYIDRVTEIDLWRAAEAKKAFEMIGEQFFSLWD